MVSIPVMDLKRQHALIRAELDSAIADVINESAFIRGPYVDDFEQKFAELAGVKHCVSCANGTDAIYIAMNALRIKTGDEVIVPAMSWISTSETVSQSGAKVVFCDVDPRTYTMCPADLKRKITKKTVGVIPVHLYGHPAPMEEIETIARGAGLWIIEDSAQAHMAELNGRKIGSWGDITTFSFYPGKNLGAFGDAGCLVTNNHELAVRATKFARHGGLRKGDHEIEGINSRLDGIQAAVLSIKMKYLAAWTERRREIASKYLQHIEPPEWLKLPTVGKTSNPVWHLFVVRVSERDEFQARMNEQGIGTSINYPKALHQLPCYAYMGHKLGDFPCAETLASSCVSLPIFPEMTTTEVESVIEAVNSFNRKR